MAGVMTSNRTKKIINEDIVTRNILNKIRTNAVLKESVSQDAIAITNDPKFGQDVLKNQINEFRSTVDGVAQFASENENSPSNSPLVYIPSSGNLVFSGTIPSLNNLKWQFSLKDSDGTGLFIWADGLRMNKENLQILNKLYGHYLNWKNQWEQSGSMLENLGKENN
jgi:hypothetical protein